MRRLPVVLAASLFLGLAAHAVLAAPPAGARVAKKGKGKAPPEQLGEVTWKVEPADVVISVDGKKVGPAGKAQAVKLKAGTHMVHLQWNKDEVEEPITVEAGKSIEFQYAFEDSGAPPAKP